MNTLAAGDERNDQHCEGQKNRSKHQGPHGLSIVQRLVHEFRLLSTGLEQISA